jgi:hypothetical protein
MAWPRVVEMDAKMVEQKADGSVELRVEWMECLLADQLVNLKVEKKEW